MQGRKTSSLNKIVNSRLLTEEAKKDTKDSVDYLKELVDKGFTLFNSLNKSGLPKNLTDNIDAQFKEHKNQ